MNGLKGKMLVVNLTREKINIHTAHQKGERTIYSSFVYCVFASLARLKWFASFVLDSPRLHRRTEVTIFTLVHLTQSQTIETCSRMNFNYFHSVLIISTIFSQLKIVYTETIGVNYFPRRTAAVR